MAECIWCQDEVCVNADCCQTMRAYVDTKNAQKKEVLTMAEWIKALDDGEPYEEESWDFVYLCTSCQRAVIGNDYNYCPWCGDKITRTPKERGGEK